VRATLPGAPTPLEMRVDAVNRRGPPIVCRITCDPLVAEGGDVLGVTILMERWREDGDALPEGGGG